MPRIALKQINWSGSFTGSFSYSTSGSHTIHGNITQNGVFQHTGSHFFSGSEIQVGTVDFTGNKTHKGTDILSGSQLITGSSFFKGIQKNTGSFFSTGSTQHTGTSEITGSLLVTGSFTNIGDLSLTGSVFISQDLTVDGRITAQEYYLEITSASIIYQSGSTVFGDTQDDIHWRTGSMKITGSQYLIGPFDHIGDSRQTGDYQITGSIFHTGSTYQIGNTTQTGSFTLLGPQTITGSTNQSGSIFLIGNKTQTGNTYLTGSSFTTGSSKLIGNSVITGSLYVSKDVWVDGKVTAQEFHTEFVSSSIIYESGSTKFGDTLDDRHEFTGSIEVSGSIDVNKYTRSNFFSQTILMDDFVTVPTQSISLMFGNRDISGSVTIPTGSIVHFLDFDGIAYSQSVLKNTTDTFNGLLTVNGQIDVLGSMTVSDTIVAQTVVELSRRELKDDIKPLDTQLEYIHKLEPVTYTFKGSEKSEYGFIVEDLEKVYPELISDNQTGVKYSRFTPILVKMIQELNKKVEVLEEEILKLKSNQNI